MSKLEKIEQSVALSDAERKRFAPWFADFHWTRRDDQLEDDVESGTLDRLANEALADLDAGRTRPL